MLILLQQLRLVLLLLQFAKMELLPKWAGL
jgi:hypothetical protein